MMMSLLGESPPGPLIRRNPPLMIVGPVYVFCGNVVVPLDTPPGRSSQAPVPFLVMPTPPLPAAAPSLTALQTCAGPWLVPAALMPARVKVVAAAVPAERSPDERKPKLAVTAVPDVYV